MDEVDDDMVSRKRPIPKEKDIMNTPDMFLTKAEREEKKRRLQSQTISVVNIASSKKCSDHLSPVKERHNVPSFFQKTSVRKQML